jgi:hypothetical protein
MQDIIITYTMSLLDAVVSIPDVQRTIGADMIPAILGNGIRRSNQ